MLLLKNTKDVYKLLCSKGYILVTTKPGREET